MTGTPDDAGVQSPGTRPGDTPHSKNAGTGPGYSGQEYDQAGQQAWRDKDAERRIPSEVVGTGKGAGGGVDGEDHDEDSAGGSAAGGS